MVGIGFLCAELKDALTPSIPAAVPVTVRMLVVQEALYPATPNEIWAVRRENERAFLRIRVIHAEVKMRIPCNLLRQVVDRAI